MLKLIKLLLIIISLLFVFLSPMKVFAEINIAPSIEWLCVDADIIFHCKIIEIKKIEIDDRIYEECTVIVDEELKRVYNEEDEKAGENEEDGKEKFKFIYRGYYWDSLDKFYEKDLLIFLKKDEEADSTKFLYGKYVLSLDEYYSFVDLSHLKDRMISGTFKVLENKEKLLNLCREIIKETKDFIKANADYEIKSMYLETAWDTMAFKVLYSGSSCYLIVPNFLFPEAKDDLY